MTFKRSTPDENYDALKFVSDEGGWELGLTSMLFGRRVRLGRVGCGWCALDYCAGADPMFQIALFITIRTILRTVPESAEYHEIELMFPGFTVKPINRDPTCWDELQRMRNKVLAEFGTEQDENEAAA